MEKTNILFKPFLNFPRKSANFDIDNSDLKRKYKLVYFNKFEILFYKKKRNIIFVAHKVQKLIITFVFQTNLETWFFN